MQACEQTQGQSVYQHGISVRDHLFELINALRNGKELPNWRFPEWLFQYKDKLLSVLLPNDILKEYTVYHDCGKPYCLTIDSDGQRHFPNHAEVSSKTWLEIGGDLQVAKLIQMDMMIHKMKVDQIDEFIKHPEAISLLLTTLSEVHSNCLMFGGIESVSFKIKWKHINKIGRKICEKLFGEQNVVD